MVDAPDDNPMLPQSSSLAILLILFLGIFLAALGSIMVNRPEAEAATDGASVPHSPSEFPEIFNQDFTAGLDLTKKDGTFQVPPPPFSEGMFPCMQCHGDLPPNAEVRKVDQDHHPAEIHHGERWCLDCHDAKDRDKLHLANGTLIPFDESYKLCGQCHGDKFRDWKEGIHGRRTGYWNGPKRYLLCVSCHNPHSPRFQPLTPLPPPVKPMYNKE